MEFTDLISSRESIRDYDAGRPVPTDVLKKILDAGRLAPSACNIQPWKFLVISSPGMLAKIRACYHHEWFKEAPHVLIVKGFSDQSWKRKADGYNSIETDLAITMTHIILAAENEGVGTCWIGNYDPALLHNAFGLKQGEVIFGITPLGYPKKDFRKSGLKNRKSFDDIVEFL